MIVVVSRSIRTDSTMPAGQIGSVRALPRRKGQKKRATGFPVALFSRGYAFLRDTLPQQDHRAPPGQSSSRAPCALRPALRYPCGTSTRTRTTVRPVRLVDVGGSAWVLRPLQVSGLYTRSISGCKAFLLTIVERHSTTPSNHAHDVANRCCHMDLNSEAG